MTDGLRSGDGKEGDVPAVQREVDCTARPPPMEEFNGAGEGGRAGQGIVSSSGTLQMLLDRDVAVALRSTGSGL